MMEYPVSELWYLDNKTVIANYSSWIMKEKEKEKEGERKREEREKEREDAEVWRLDSK